VFASAQFQIAFKRGLGTRQQPMNVGDIVKVQIDRSFVRGRIIGIPENRGKVLYKVEFADSSTIPQWFDAAKVLPD
jgi:hypothetical protein